MSIRKINILCEGQTEQRFVSKVLSPYLQPYGIVVKPQLLITNKKLNARGGMIDYGQSKRDLTNMIASCKDNSYEKNFFSTMFDLYALPNDFPGSNSPFTNCYDRVIAIESAFAQDINHYRFVPYIELHEFEALVLCNISQLKEDYPNASRNLEALDNKWRMECNGNPELVNTHTETAPSKRIISALSEYYNYDKVKSGTDVTLSYGIDNLRHNCKHFNQWIETLLSLQ